MPNLLAISFEAELAPSFDLRCLEPGGQRPDGWGLGYYPGSEPSASVLKEPAPPAGSIRSELVSAWQHLESSLFVLHVRHATWGRPSDANTQPFQRSYSGRDWLFCHAGTLEERPKLDDSPRFEPVGSTDTELAFCVLMNRVAASEARSLVELDPAVLAGWMRELNAGGSFTVTLTDGRDLVVYADREGAGDVHLWRLLPPHQELRFGDTDVEIDLMRRGRKAHKGIVVSTSALWPAEGPAIPWTRLSPGHLLVIRQGAIVAEVADDRSGGSAPLRPLVRERAASPRPAEPRQVEVLHRTVYRYLRAVERSSHLLRLTPIHDRMQAVLSHSITLSVDAGEERHYDDVFGNQVRRILLDRPFSELVIEARSLVELRDVDPLAFRPLHHRSSIPLVWMPWQRHMLNPYLLPPELPESELRELATYAMTFVERNDYDLLETLLDINATIFDEYRYEQGSTSITTTAFDVYAARRGVCQDFANLFICMARLLGVPARYVCGYIYTGPKHENQRQSEASHAWVQVYLPEIGWKGFDPTNGVMTQTDHVRVAVGRTYVDATPTSGTIYVGGAGETLEVEVRCELADGGRRADP